MMTSASAQTTKARFAGLLLGTAMGDALGLPAENLSAARIRRLWPGEWKMRFIFGRGMAALDRRDGTNWNSFDGTKIIPSGYRAGTLLLARLYST